MARPITKEESAWIKSVDRLLKKQPAGTSLYAEGGGTLHMYDNSEYEDHDASGDCLGQLEPLGTAKFGPRFDCGGF